MTFTYRIRISNLSEVRVEKRDAEQNVLGNPVGHFNSENLEQIRTCHQAAAERKLLGDDVEALGELLFHTLLDERLRYDFFSFYETAKRENRSLRIELEVDETQLPEIVALPWEFLSVPASNQSGKIRIATDLNVVFSRWRAQAQVPHLIQLQPGERLRIALVVSAPEDLGTVKYEKIHQSLQELARTEDIQILDVLINSDRAGIDRILEQQPHVFHFIGHGRLKDENRQDSGEIALSDRLGNALWTNAGDFSELFTRHQPGVVLLQACESGALSASEAFVGMASRVVQQNIPVVVAMQYEVSNMTATRFALEFYRRLAKGEPADKAVQEGRRQIELSMSEKGRDFATPVIFMRVQDGHLFQRTEGPEDGGQAKLSPQKIQEGLTFRMLEIKPVFSSVIQQLKRIKADGATDDDEINLTIIGNFLNQNLEAQEFIQMWTDLNASSRQAVHSEEPNYDALARRLNDGQMIPFIGSDVLYLSGLPSSFFEDMVQRLAQEANYPDDKTSLSVICQYYEMTEHSRYSSLKLIKSLLKQKLSSLRPNPCTGF